MREERYKAWVKTVGDMPDESLIIIKRPAIIDGIMKLECEDGGILYIPTLYIKKVAIKPEE